MNTRAHDFPLQRCSATINYDRHSNVYMSGIRVFPDGSVQMLIKEQIRNMLMSHLWLSPYSVSVLMCLVKTSHFPSFFFPLYLDHLPCPDSIFPVLLIFPHHQVCVLPLSLQDRFVTLCVFVPASASCQPVLCTLFTILNFPFVYSRFCLPWLDCYLVLILAFLFIP